MINTAPPPLQKKGVQFRFVWSCRNLYEKTGIIWPYANFWLASQPAWVTRHSWACLNGNFCRQNGKSLMGFPQVPSKTSQKYTKIMENHPLSISFPRFWESRNLFSWMTHITINHIYLHTGAQKTDPLAPCCWDPPFFVAWKPQRWAVWWPPKARPSGLAFAHLHPARSTPTGCKGSFKKGDMHGTGRWLSKQVAPRVNISSTFCW